MREQAEFPSGRIERSSPVPFYFQLSALLELEIVSGRWSPGSRLPSEPALGDHFGVSRTTVRQALGRLEQEGLVVKRKGQGTFVGESRVRSWMLQASAGFFLDELLRGGRQVTSRVLRAERTVLPRWAADALELPPNSGGVVLERVRAVDGLVALYVVNHLPERLADAVLMLDHPTESLYERLSTDYDTTVHGARRVLEAVTAGRDLADLLEVERGAALAFIDSVSWDSAFRPFDCYRAWVRTDRLRIEIEAQATSIPAPVVEFEAAHEARS
jgi:GntR family transcriptional regulator